ncbi:3-oxoacyl-[acyl-carrier-protein] synthase III C-terminal domain-containing protein [Paraburkholderia tropica]|uniref:3-oxoacyl-[acyl-carrier-protein] synthase III C-terminal domain-containing protein n=1 Tax=Paraburkholderia tropica TaxID=92647 RepID=UPI001F461B80|nr:3-oxoacyl-[acyl-carrier-protein] synthase III C-terminal domain-containing protein [Paraburkholderia tropica]
MQTVYADTLRWCHDAMGTTPVDLPSTPLHAASEPGLLLSEMASSVAREAIGRCPANVNIAPDQVIVCATSLEQDYALSCAGRLHSELGSTGVPFAIGQLQGVSFFLALQMVSDMMARDNHVSCALIVAAERWLPPFSRLARSVITALGDGAAAVLVTAHTHPAWDVLSVNVRTPPVPIPPYDIGIDEGFVVEVIAQTCMQAGVTPGAIDWVVPPRIDATLARRINVQARLSGQTWYPDQHDCGYLCAADAPAQLDALLHATIPAQGQLILLWSAGFQRQAGCAILRYRGSQP